ncbi:hypothetical protein [Thiorhodovibrio winogradskyi]|nr:hypothetical protein [Thiorhodovibrio winogradskyi]
MIEIPEDLCRRHVEVVFLELDERETPEVASGTDWPEGLFERTAGAWQGEPLKRGEQGQYEQRLELD